MKMVSPFVLRGLATASLGFLAACSGTPAEEPDPGGGSDGGPDPSVVELDDVTNDPMLEPTGSQDPDDQAVGQQRRNFLVDKSLDEARRALDLRLWSDAAKIASEVLEIDPSNTEARRILVDAQGRARRRWCRTRIHRQGSPEPSRASEDAVRRSA